MDSRKAHVRSARVFRKAREPELFPVTAEGMLPEEDLSRFIRLAVGKLDSAVLRDLYKDYGGIAYDPVSLLGVWLLGYCLGIASSRELEDRCRFDVRFIHVSGGAQPDDRTLGRFRRRITPVMESLLVQVLELCIQAGLAPMKRIAIDGTKMASPASQLGRWLAKCNNLDEGLLEPMELSDPDAKALAHRGKKAVLGYNVQVAVDADTGLVLAADIVDSACDRAQLAQMLERTVRMTGQTPQEVLTDSGYDSNVAHQACHSVGAVGHIPPQGEGLLFWTVVGENEIVCPLGSPVRLARTTQKRGELHDIYSPTTCPSCIFASTCLTNRDGRTLLVPHGTDPTLRILAAHRARSPEGYFARIARMSSVETFFGRVKANLRLCRFKLRGEAGARLEMMLIAISQNLRALAKLFLALISALLARHSPKTHWNKTTNPTAHQLT